MLRRLVFVFVVVAMTTLFAAAPALARPPRPTITGVDMVKASGDIESGCGYTYSATFQDVGHGR